MKVFYTVHMLWSLFWGYYMTLYWRKQTKMLGIMRVKVFRYSTFVRCRWKPEMEWSSGPRVCGQV